MRKAITTFTTNQRRLSMKTQRIMPLIGALIVLALVVTACNKGGSSPTATAKAFYDAAKSKDVAGMKSMMSKKTLDALDQFAKANHTTVDELLTKSNDKEPPPATLEVRNEKI